MHTHAQLYMRIHVRILLVIAVVCVIVSPCCHSMRSRRKSHCCHCCLLVLLTTMSVQLLRDGFDPTEVQVTQLIPTTIATLFQVGGRLFVSCV